MATYTLAVGTGDPTDLFADDDDTAIALAVQHVRARLDGGSPAHPEEVVTLLGPDGPLTRASERLDEFVHRVPGKEVPGEADTMQPGDSNAPDCNGD